MRLRYSLLSIAVAATVSLQASATDLLDIYKDAYAADPTVQQAKATRDYYYAAVDEATAALLPQIDVTGSLSATRTNVQGDGKRGNYRYAGAELSLSQALWRHSSWVNRSIAEKQALQYDLAYQDALQNLIIRVCNAYFNVLNASDTLTFQKANNVALKRQLDEANRQFQVGLIAETDRLEAQAAYDLSNASVINAENNLINSYEGIRALTGKIVTIDELSKLDVDKFSTPEVGKTLIALIKEAEENNLSLQQSVIARDVANDGITLAMTGHEPVLSLNASAGTNYTRYSHESTSRSTGNNWAESIGLTLSIPIYHGGETSAQVEEAEANYVNACQALEYAHRTLVTNVNNDYNNVNAAILSVRAYNQSVISATSALDATQAGYEVGTRTMTDVLDATQNLYSALQQAAASRYQYIENRFQLAYDHGELKVEHLEQVNSGLKK